MCGSSSRTPASGQFALESAPEILDGRLAAGGDLAGIGNDAVAVAAIDAVQFLDGVEIAEAVPVYRFLFDAVVAEVARAGGDLLDMHVRSPHLGDVYLRHVGAPLEED